MLAKLTYRRRYLTGLTLIEIMLAILVLMVVVIGTSGYRYYSALDARRAMKHETASRIASLLNEGWRGAADVNMPFNPADILPNISTSGDGPATPNDFILLNNTKYKVVSEGASYFITMAYRFAESGGGIKDYHKRIVLTTIVAWPITTSEAAYSPQGYREYILTTYVEKRI